MKRKLTKTTTILATLGMILHLSLPTEAAPMRNLRSANEAANMTKPTVERHVTATQSIAEEEIVLELIYRLRMPRTRMTRWMRLVEIRGPARGIRPTYRPARKVRSRLLASEPE